MGHAITFHPSTTWWQGGVEQLNETYFQKEYDELISNELHLQCSSGDGGSRPLIQKLTKRSILDRNTGQQRTPHPGQHQETNAPAGKPHFVSFKFLVSDSVRRDGFGMSETALRTHLYGLCDDSLTEISEFEFSVRYVEPGLEGV